MASRTASKPGRPAAKGTVKTPGKDQIKSEKPTTNVLEIVPGKFNENDWLLLLENDETEDFIADIFDDIWKETSRHIEQIYIRRQLLPFTLMMTEQALSCIIQWAFLERDEPKPATGDFWTEDKEPIPCSMDNWGEGAVPACREERPQNIEESPSPVAEHSPSAPIDIPTPEDHDQVQGPSTSSTQTDIETSNQPYKIDSIHQESRQEETMKSDITSHTSTRKESSTEQTTCRSSLKQKPSNYDILVIETQPPKLEPLSDLFDPKSIQTTNSSYYTTPATITAKRRRFIAARASSQLGSDALASTTNITETTKSTKKIESKLFDDQHIEDVISKAPAAAQSMLKSILSRPPGYRELELDDYGNVISIAKLDPDKLGTRSVRVKCDIVKPRKAMIETRSLPKQPQQMKLYRSEPKFTSVKLALPERSTNVGDLIQPMPGVLYEDSKLKKGDPRRYKNVMSRYTSFYDENRPLRPIAQRGDLNLLQSANELLRKSKDYNDDNDNKQDSQIPKLHRFTRMPPIVSASSTS